MVEWTQLLLPILLSAVFVFFASSAIHMVVKWHNSDYGKLQNEDVVRAAFNEHALKPGQYILPHCVDPKEGAAPEMVAKFEEGPVAVVYVKKSGRMELGPFLGKWFLYTAITSVIVAAVLRSQIAPGAESQSVFTLAGITAWLGYAWAGPADSIWMGKPWRVTVKHMLDGVIYAALTALAFSWMWPGIAE